MMACLRRLTSSSRTLSSDSLLVPISMEHVVSKVATRWRRKRTFPRRLAFFSPFKSSMSQFQSSVPEDHPFRKFRNFAQMLWAHLNLPPLTPLQLEVCDWMQYGPKRNQTWGFRGIGKSYLCSGYAAWSLFINPDEKILVISASKERADQFVKFTRRLIEDVPMLHHLRPDRNRGDQDSSVSFEVGCCTPAHSPSVRAIGITGQLAGSRASLIIMDDVEIPSNSSTPVQREKLAEAVKECDAVLLPANEELGVDPRVRVLGTPQSMETVYLQLEERNYVPRIWPIQVPDTPTYLGYRGNLAPSIQAQYDAGDDPGTPTEPSRFHIADIAERRMSYGALSFALQFMLSTALSDAEKYPLKTKDLMFDSFSPERGREVYIHSNHPQFKLEGAENVGMQGDGFYRPADVIGEWKPFDRTVLIVDPSGRGKDETAIVSGSLLGGQVFVHRVLGSVKGYTEETLVMIAEEARRIKATKVVVEGNYGDGMFSQLLRPVLQRIYPCTIEEVKVTGNKELRIIDTLSPAFEAHKVIFHESCPKSDKVPHEGDVDSDMRARDRQLFYQMTHLTPEKGCLAHDDRLDAVALLVAHFSEFMNLDANAEMRAREEELARAAEDSGIITDQPESWFDCFEPGVTITAS